LLVCLLVAGSPTLADESQQKKAAAGEKPSEQDSGKASFPREELRYDGKDFNFWRRELAVELKPERRLECIRVLATGDSVHRSGDFPQHL
jgi:hypothetical protein